MTPKLKEYLLLTSDTPFGAPVYYKEITDSTMNDAAFLIGEGAVHGTVIRAGSQTEGRGRLTGRLWKANPNENLLFTLILNQKSASKTSLPLSLLMGYALSRFLEEEKALSPRIKWPNDVLVEGRKISGILCESRRSFFTAGIGINLNQTEFSAGMNRPPVSLKMAAGIDSDPQDILLSLLDYIASALDYPPLKSELEDRLFGKGETVRTLIGKPGTGDEITGILSGIQDDGALLLKIPEEKGFYTVYSGEILY